MPPVTIFFIETIRKLRPGTDFANTDNTLAGIRWDTPGVIPPTQEEVDAAILDMAREARCDEVDALHATKERHGFIYNGVRYELDDKSQGKIASVASEAGFAVQGVAGIEWTATAWVAADNSVTPFATAASFLPFANAAKQAAKALFARRYALKVACRAATTAEALAAIDASSGLE